MLARVVTSLIEAAFQNFRNVIAAGSGFSLWFAVLWAFWFGQGLIPPATVLIALPVVLVITTSFFGIERRPPAVFAGSRVHDMVRLGARVWVGSAFAALFATGSCLVVALLWAVGQASLDTIVVQAGTMAPTSLEPASQAIDPIFRLLATVAMAIAALTIGYGYTVGQRRVDLTRLTIPLRVWPTELEGLRVAHISDVHVGPYLDAEQLGGYVDRVNALFPDLIIITGDIVDDRASDLDAALPILARLHAPLGVVAILGNHDHAAGADDVAERLQRGTDFVLLRDSSTTLMGPRGSRLHLIGIEDRGGAIVRGAEEEQHLEALLVEIPADDSVILLAHRPELFESAARAGVALTLSGHTHGGQIALPLGGTRVLSPGNLMSRYVRGLFERAGSYLYVNRGLGVVGQAVRVGASREIALLTLMGARDKTPAHDS
jgi:predicted MPP superfamily phosphohydrolase